MRAGIVSHLSNFRPCVISLSPLLIPESLHWWKLWILCTESFALIVCTESIEWIPRIHWESIEWNKIHWMNPLCTESPESFALNPLHWSFELNRLSRGNLHQTAWTHWNQMRREKGWNLHHRITAAEISLGIFLLASYQQLRPFPSNHPLQLAKLKVGSFEKKRQEK